MLKGEKMVLLVDDTTREFFAAAWDQACVEVDRYARSKANPHSPALFDDAGNARWITIGGDVGADGKKHGGHPVKITKDGTMLTGHFAGKKVDEAFGGKASEPSEPTEPSKPSEHGYFRGNKGRKTGRKQTMHGGEFEELEMLEGEHKGQMKWIPTKEQDDKNVQQTQQRHADMQAGFKRLNEAQGQPTEPNKPKTDWGKRLDDLQQRRDPDGIEKPKPSPVIEPPKPTSNESAKPGDQLGLFGEATQSPSPKPKIDGDPKAKQGALFNTSGAAGQMDLFDADKATPDDLVWKGQGQQQGQGDKPKQEPSSPGGTPEQPKPASAKPKKPFVYPNGMTQSFDSEGKPAAIPTEPKPTAPEKATQSFDAAINAGETPRQAAAAATKAMDADYEFARASTVSNAGEDLKGSARHKVNAWRSLEDAEKNGTAKELVTRDQLLKNEPHDLMIHADRNPLTSLAMHFALRSFPAKPGTKLAANAKKDREQFLEAYRSVKAKAEELAKGTEAEDALGKLQSHVSDLIKKFRGQTSSGSMGLASATDKYNQTANDLVGFANSLANGWRAPKNGPYGRLKEFMDAAKERYGSDAASHENLPDHVKDIIEGASMNKTFDKEAKQSNRFNPADMYVKIATRNGGRDLSSITSDPNKATNHMIKEMGLRGVQWGNSVTDDERQHHAAKAVEALTDLADALGLHPKDIALNGKLGLAIGARGRGGAVAHYEPDTQVINLTRANGVGSLAHEWGHAFDHSLADFALKKDSSEMMSDVAHHTHRLTNPEGTYSATTDSGTAERHIKNNSGWKVEELKNAEVRKAFQSLKLAQEKYRDRLRDELRSMIRDKFTSVKKANDYWNSEPEIFARTFERYVQHKIESSGKKNTYLAGIETKSHKAGGLWPTDDEVKAMAPAFDKLFAEFRKQKYGSEEVVKYSQAELLEAAAMLIGTGDLFFDVERYRSECRFFLMQYSQWANGAKVDRYDWNESQHPRHPAGAPRGMGGEFAGRGSSLPGGNRIASQSTSQSTSNPSGPPPTLNSKQRELPERPQISQNHPLHWRQIPDGTAMIGTMDFAKGLRNLMAEAQRAAGPQANEETVWARVDKRRLQGLLDSMNRMDKEAMAKGIKLHEYVNASGLIPPMIAERLHGGSRFFDPTLLRGKFNQPDVEKTSSKSFADQIGANKPQPESEAKSGGKQRSQAATRTDEPKPKKTAAESRLDNQLTDAIRKHLGSDDESMIDEFKQFHSEAHKQLTDEANETNRMIREITGTAKNLGESRSGFNEQGQQASLLRNPMETGKLMKKARQGLLDPSKEKGFDELVDWAERHYPHLLKGNGEQGLVDLLAGGFRVPPSRLSDEVMEHASTLAGPSFFEALANGGQAPVPDDGVDWEQVPFSAVAFNRIWNMVVVERYGSIHEATLREFARHHSQPTPAQREAGNYKKGHIRFQGLDIAIETPKGKRRRPEWPPMGAHYGYIKRTEGKDGDHLDVFVGPDETSPIVFIVDQMNADGKFDEHKCLLGFRTHKQAIEAYKASYSAGWKVGQVSAMTMEQFKNWIEDGDLKKPASVQVNRYAMARMV
jgi:hypothetical protein